MFLASNMNIDKSCKAFLEKFVCQLGTYSFLKKYLKIKFKDKPWIASALQKSYLSKTSSCQSLSQISYKQYRNFFIDIVKKSWDCLQILFLQKLARSWSFKEYSQYSHHICYTNSKQTYIFHIHVFGQTFGCLSQSIISDVKLLRRLPTNSKFIKNF